MGILGRRRAAPLEPLAADRELPLADQVMSEALLRLTDAGDDLSALMLSRLEVEGATVRLRVPDAPEIMRRMRTGGRVDTAVRESAIEAGIAGPNVVVLPA